MAFGCSVRGLQVCKANAARTSPMARTKLFARDKRRNVSAKAADITPELRDQIAKAMQDPNVRQGMKAMQELMQRPEMPSAIRDDYYVVQRQLAEWQDACMPELEGNQLVMQPFIDVIKDDPEFKAMFVTYAHSKMGALMKQMDDPKALAGFWERIVDVQVPADSIPKINNIFDAARYGDFFEIERLLEDQDVNAGDKESCTPLHYASRFGHPAIAGYLIAEGAQLDVRDNKGNTPLHYAAKYGQAELVEELVTAGSDVTAKNNDGQTPYELVVADERNPLNEDLPVVDKLRTGVTL